jgi:hypothetical protein
MWESPLLTRRLGTSCRAVATVAAECFTCTESIEVHACVRVCVCMSGWLAILACDGAPTWSTNAGRHGPGGTARGQHGTGPAWQRASMA